MRFKKNEFLIENIKTKILARKFKTPLYCYSYKKIKENIQNPNTDTLLESYKFRLLWLYFQIKIHNIIIKSLKTNSCNLDTIYDLQHWLFSVKQQMQKKIQKTTGQATGTQADASSMLDNIPKTGWQ